jgi:hypothetical protein
MAAIVLDYSDSLSEHHSLTYEYGEGSLWFQTPGFCPYCQISGRAVDERSWQDVDSDDSAACWYGSQSAYACDCGWWDLVDDEWTGTSSTEGSLHWRTVTHGVLKRYDVNSLHVPLDTLRREITRKVDLIYDLHDRKMEELVGAILKDFFPGCEVTLCGRSHDRGIDLLVVRAEQTMAVQVKRRRSASAVEPVSLVREFLGAVLLNGAQDAMFVTTADHFTSEAQSAADRAVTRSLVSKFDLINLNRFVGMIAATGERITKPWKRVSR